MTRQKQNLRKRVEDILAKRAAMRDEVERAEHKVAHALKELEAVMLHVEDEIAHE